VLGGPLIAGTSNPGTVTSDFGGVARNVAENLVRLGRGVRMVSRVGDDETGRAVVGHLAGLGVDTAAITVSQRATASYTAILQQDGELVLGLADMGIYDEITPALLEPALPQLLECELWFVDANLPADTLRWIAEVSSHLALTADAVSVVKSRKLTGILDVVSPLFLNVAQAAAVLGTDGFADAESAARAMSGRVLSGVVTAGASGVAERRGARNGCSSGEGARRDGGGRCADRGHAVRNHGRCGGIFPRGATRFGGGCNHGRIGIDHGRTPDRGTALCASICISRLIPKSAAPYRASVPWWR
jgi:hypothetical protein